MFTLLLLHDLISRCYDTSPLVQNSGQGGRVILPTTNVTAPGGEFGSVPVGAPFFGHDANNDHICEYCYHQHYEMSVDRIYRRVLQRHPRRYCE